MIKSKLRDHEIEHNGKEWIYSDTKESTIKTHQNRSCGLCNKMATPEGHDACLGILPNVMNACCGHGEINEAYVQYWDTSVVRGDRAIKAMQKLRGDSDE